MKSIKAMINCLVLVWQIFSYNTKERKMLQHFVGMIWQDKIRWRNQQCKQCIYIYKIKWKHSVEVKSVKFRKFVYEVIQRNVKHWYTSFWLIMRQDLNHSDNMKLSSSRLTSSAGRSSPTFRHLQASGAEGGWGTQHHPANSNLNQLSMFARHSCSQCL